MSSVYTTWEDVVPFWTRTDHDGRVTKYSPSHKPSDQSRYERLYALAVTAHHEPERATSAWLATQLEEIGASLDEFDAATHQYLSAASGGDYEAPEPLEPQDDIVDDIDYAATIRQSWAAEKRAAARTDHWLAQADQHDPDFDWVSLAKLLGTSDEILRRRAGAPVDGKLPRVGVSHDGLPPQAAAAALGIGRSTLYRWISEGRVTQVPVNGRPRIVTDGNGMPIVQSPETDD